MQTIERKVPEHMETVFWDVCSTCGKRIESKNEKHLKEIMKQHVTLVHLLPEMEKAEVRRR